MLQNGQLQPIQDYFWVNWRYEASLQNRVTPVEGWLLPLHIHTRWVSLPSHLHPSWPDFFCLFKSLHLLDPCHFNLWLVINALRYVSGTIILFIFIPADIPLISFHLSSVGDAWWIINQISRCSVLGFVVSICIAPIYYRSMRQTVVSLYSVKAEYFALSYFVKKNTRLRRVYHYFCHQFPWSGVISFEPIVIYRMDDRVGGCWLCWAAWDVPSHHTAFPTCWSSVFQLSGKGRTGFHSRRNLISVASWRRCRETNWKENFGAGGKRNLQVVCK